MNKEFDALQEFKELQEFREVAKRIVHRKRGKQDRWRTEGLSPYGTQARSADKACAWFGILLRELQVLFVAVIS